MANLPAFFGPPEGVDSKDYLLMMAGSSPIDTPVSLIGHSLTSPSADSSDPLKVTRVELKNGRIRTVVKTKRAAEVRSRSYTIGFPAGALWSPAQQAALRRGCRSTFYMKYLCPDDRRFNHAYIFPEGIMDEPVESGDMITVDDQSMLSSTSVLTVPNKLTLWGLGFEIIKTIGGTPAVEALAGAFTTEDCPGCDSTLGLGMVVVGADGTAAPTGLVTDDRFSSSTVLSPGGTAATYATAVATKGDVIVVGTSDVKAIATGAAGTLRVSSDKGVSWQAVSGVTVPIRGICLLGNTFVAVGGAGASAAVAYYSEDNGASWTAIPSGSLPAANAFAACAADDINNRVYMVGEGGQVSVATFAAGIVTVVDLSANIPTFSGVVNAVNVFSPNHIAIGGATNYYAESFDGGATWVSPGVPGTAAVVGIAGDDNRAVVVTTDGLHMRDLMTDFIYRTVTLENGQTVTGDYAGVKMNNEDDFNIFFAWTDDGELVFGKPFYPNA